MITFIFRVLLFVLKKSGVPSWVISDLRHYLYLIDLNLRNHFFPKRLAIFKDIKRRKNLRIHLGSGGCYLNGWINLDAYLRLSRGHRVDCLMDCRSLSLFKEESCELIYSHHFFEHLDQKAELLPLLADILRILKPGGVLRIAVPDLEFYLRRYQGVGKEIIDAAKEINSIFYDHEHRYMYDYYLLRELLEEVGFRNVIKSSCNGSRYADFPFEKEKGTDAETLYVEALK